MAQDKVFTQGVASQGQLILDLPGFRNTLLAPSIYPAPSPTANLRLRVGVLISLDARLLREELAQAGGEFVGFLLGNEVAAAGDRAAFGFQSDPSQ